MPVVALHGLGADHHEPFDLLGPVLSARTDVCAPDMRAHGESLAVGGPEDFTADRLAEETIQVVRQWLHDRTDAEAGITLVGISAGAMLALRVACARALPLARLVLLRPAFTDQPSPENLRPLGVIAELLETWGTEEGLRRFTTDPLYRSIADRSPRAALSLTAQFSAPLAVERAVRLREIPRNVAFPQDFVPPEIDTLIVSSVGDPIHPEAVADLWARRIPRAVTARVPNRDVDLRLFTEGFRRCVAGWLPDAVTVEATLAAREQVAGVAGGSVR